MNRIQSPSSSPAPSFHGFTSLDRSSSELGELLTRLQKTVLHADPEREQRLRRSEYERAKLEANLEYASATLSRLESDAAGILAPGRRLEVQGDLRRKRDLLELLADHVQDLHKMAVDDDDDDDDAEVDDMLASIIPSEKAPAATTTTDVPAASTATATTTTATATPTPAPAEAPAPPVATAAPSSQPTQTDQTLRSRATPSYAEARAALFANRRRAAGDDAPDKAAATTGSTTATAEAILDQQSAEREDLAAKVFQLAQAMKRQQMEMADSLESEKDVLGRATEGMERTGRGMDAAKGRMGALVRMTEGKGWWGRVILYAWVYGLMVALVLLVFVLPKLRF